MSYSPSKQYKFNLAVTLTYYPATQPQPAISPTKCTTGTGPDNLIASARSTSAAIISASAATTSTLSASTTPAEVGLADHHPVAHCATHTTRHANTKPASISSFSCSAGMEHLPNGVAISVELVGYRHILTSANHSLINTKGLAKV